MTTHKNRNRIKQWFITYPQWPSDDKHLLRDQLLPLEPDYYFISRETHQDGNIHFHAIIRLKKAQAITSLLKHFKQIYPDDYKRIHFKALKSAPHALTYLSKEDQDPLKSHDIFPSNRKPSQNVILHYLRAFGFDSQESFNLHMQKRKDSDSILLDINAQFELDLAKSIYEYGDIYKYPGIDKFYEIHRKVTRPIYYVSNDDITFFQEFYKSYLFPLTGIE